MDKKICRYCDNYFKDQILLEKHQKSSKYCIAIQNKIDPIEEKYTDMKKYYELSLLNLQTKLFELQGQNMIYKQKIKNLETKQKKSSWF